MYHAGEIEKETMGDGTMSDFNRGPIFTAKGIMGPVTVVGYEGSMPIVEDINGSRYTKRESSLTRTFRTYSETKLGRDFTEDEVRANDIETARRVAQSNISSETASIKEHIASIVYRINRTVGDITRTSERMSDSGSTWNSPADVARNVYGEVANMQYGISTTIGYMFDAVRRLDVAQTQLNVLDGDPYGERQRVDAPDVAPEEPVLP